ncbi:hypothetical protein KP509_19G000700 [Ceratopteris richardii]|nr:hypothetical protein KP509_19G000700 [Ceratopteris richardii]
MGFFENNCVLGSALVDMYAGSGMLEEAQNVFDMLSVQDVVSWTSLLFGYAKHGYGQMAFYCLEKMQQNGILPNATTFVCCLKACGNICASIKGSQVHAMIVGSGVEVNIYVGSALIDMYIKCGFLAKAQEAFDGLTVRNVVSWNSLLTGYVEYDLHKEALSCFQKMQDESIPPDPVTFACSLRACSSIRDISKGQAIHIHVIEKGFETDFIIGNTLIDMYVKCSYLEEAHDVFSKLLHRNVVSWTILVSGYIDSNLTQEAFNCLEAMRNDGINPTAATFVCSLKACMLSGEVEKGQEIHAEITRIGIEKQLLICNTLISMYGFHDLFLDAFDVLENLPSHDVVTWNALITAFVYHGYNQEALDCMVQMHQRGISPDPVTYICTLKACCDLGSREKGRELHMEIIKQGISGTENSIYNSLVAMYAKFGLILEAKDVFDYLMVKNVIAWNSLLTTYTEHGHFEAVIKCLEDMELQGISPDLITIVCSLKSCGNMGAREKGREIHSFISCKGLEEEPPIGNTLVYMYAKCGLLATAQFIFDKLSDQNVVSWTALLAGYAQLGSSENVFCIFKEMTRAGITPDMMTFGSVLSSCSYAGLVEEGHAYFQAMHNDDDLIPSPWHQMCMIDLLGRAGQVERAVAFAMVMPCHPHGLAWHTILGACRKWGLMYLGDLAFKHAFELDDQDAPACVCLCNIYCDIETLEDENDFRVVLTD